MHHPAVPASLANLEERLNGGYQEWKRCRFGVHEKCWDVKDCLLAGWSTIQLRNPSKSAIIRITR